MRIAIWGSGPAGMLAAHAAKLAGHDFSVFAKDGPSALHGAQYLHEAIPGLPLAKAELRHIFRGTVEEYRRKVYSEMHVDSVSPQQFQGTSVAYDIRDMYDHLVLRYGHHVRMFAITQTDLLGLGGDWSMTRWNTEYDMIVNTVPRKVLCVNPAHKFNEAKIWALGEAPELGITSPIQTEDQTLICSGSPNDSWYRLSRIFGHTTVEWPGNRNKPPIKGVVPVFKPTSTDCTCWPEVRHIGRFGQWKKGVLTHHAFREAAELFLEQR